MSRFCHLIALTLLFAGCDFFRPTNDDFALTNKTAETIMRCTIQVSSHTFEFTDIAPGEKVAKAFTVNGDSHFDIECLYTTGRKDTASLGYVTRGMAVNLRFQAETDGIYLTQAGRGDHVVQHRIKNER